MPIPFPRTAALPIGKRPWLLVLGLTLGAACATHRSPPPAVPHGDLVRYEEARAKLVRDEQSRALGAGQVLTPEEEEANRRLMALKQSELGRTRADFPPAHSFLQAKTRELIESSPVLAIMRRLPKGGILHAHGAAAGDFRWLIAQATYRPDCYVYRGAGPTIPGTLRFFASPPGGGWRSTVELRAGSPDARAFDEEIYRSITLGDEDLDAPDIWEEFTNCFRRAFSLFEDGSFYTAFWRQMIDRLIDENVQYVETRSSPFDVDAILREARRRDPLFEVKFIPAAGRSAGREGIAEELHRFLDERQADPGRVVGFDLVENEDTGHTNHFFAGEFLAAREEAARRGTDLPLYLHSGESNLAENDNLYDAVLLGTRRIGHGLALVKHPLLMEIVKARGIAVEVCPISNQVLGYVPDLRNHPAVSYVNAGLEVVLAPDDPGLMRHSLSHDFYEAFMAWGLDLRGLKQLAMNSLLYSAMGTEEKRRALDGWQVRWNAFVRWLDDQPEVSLAPVPVAGWASVVWLGGVQRGRTASPR
jgi:adenosine deaminase CECR1